LIKRPQATHATEDIAVNDEIMPAAAAIREDAHVAPAHRFLIFATVATALMMPSVDLTIVSTALPVIGRDVGGYDLDWTSWIITSYSLGRVVVTPMTGRLGELMGTRKIFIAALLVFTVSSLLCGVARSLPMLITLRTVQSIGGAAFIPSATTLVAEAFPENRDRAVGLFSSIIPIGAIIGPVLGGVIVSYWSWRGVFLINVPIGAVVVIAAVKLIPAIAPKPAQKFDLIGSVLLAVSLLTLALAITYLGDTGHGLDLTFAALAAVATIAGVLLVRRSSRAGAILPRELLYGNGFGTVNIINVLYGAAGLGLSALVPVYAQSRYEMSSLASGTLLTARGVGMISVAALAVFALRRTGYRAPMAVGYFLCAVGLIMLAAPPPMHVSPQWWLSISALVVGVGMGVALPASNNALMQIDPSKIASITGLRITLRQLGSIAAVSITSALMTRSAHPGHTEAWVFVAFAATLLAIVTLVPLIPDHRARW
jgi:EmrB/QacA subfamily drug resistance transporter